MLLSELSPRLIRIGEGGEMIEVQTLAESEALDFTCPLCIQGEGFKHPDGEVMYHSTYILNENMKQSAFDGHNKWVMSGELENLTVIPSILFKQPCGAHFYIRNGEIVGLTEEK